MTAGGADIWGDSDEFHFAWQELSGSGTIVAKVESVENTDSWAKAGVMIRDTLDADSPHAMVAVTPGGGVWFGHRQTAGGGSDSIGEPGITAPQWVKLERSIGGLVRAYYSTDGTNWTPLGTPEPVIMDTPMYIGLALTSHSPGVACEAKFSNVTSNGTGAWVNQDIGLLSNEAQPMYVAVSNQNGASGTVYHGDANATLINAWTEWNIDLKDLSDQGVDMTDVNSIAIGFGDKDPGAPGQAGGAGTMYFDDVRDLEIMTNDWLKADSFETGLLTHLAFDEASGDTAGDSSDSGHDGVVVGATWHAGGYDGTGSSLEFAGDGGHVVDEDAEDYLNGLSALTVCMWIKSNLIDTDQGFINGENPDGGDNVVVMRYDAAGSSFAGTNVFKMVITSTLGGEQQLESSSNLQTTDWQHVAMTWSSGDLIRSYVNAVEDTPSGRNGENNAGTVSGCTKLIIGKGSKDQAADAGWDGLIDDVRIYKRALSQAQIATVNNGGTLTELHYYPLESAANVVDDELQGSKTVNFRDFAVLADQWLEELVWPEF
jgi:hypothetical protein